ncbi:MAG: hypothetical protein A4S09_07015 [Proteobacteria bacterium SG_bin7]|nr:MAG: hypothetical protein A4S09_07015 [Proteobacteria bacterium SG_bin7]
MSSPEEKAREYLATKALYMLGDLTTERPHPQTTQLSQLANSDLSKILLIIKNIELKLVSDLKTHLNEINLLQSDIEQTLRENGKIFICGCGATGRLALTLEFLWRSLSPNNLRDKVIGFMAGGDVALVRSLERIEDSPEMGSQHLRSLGFTQNDLLISCTEGGETPYVIGATEEAAWVSKRKPYFLFCNSTSILSEKVERSKRVIENNNIISISLAIDPMVLAGSTRLQATTALLLTVGSALFPKVSANDPSAFFDEYESDIQNLDFLKLKPFIELESITYQKNEKTLYETKDYGITILTDTTERSPTFSLTPFENFREESNENSLCYLHLVPTKSTYEAWQKLLNRPPRGEGRPDWIIAKGEEWVFGYDFSVIGKENRLNRLKGISHTFNIRDQDESISFEFRGAVANFPLKTEKLFLKHLILKVLLNTHSTLVMGRLNRYQNNIMTYVKPSCGKLVDRAIRNILFILKHSDNHLGVSYDELAYKVFQEMPQLHSSEAIVMKIISGITKH